MSDLDRAQTEAPVDPIIDDELAPDTAADGHVQERRKADAGTLARFGQRGDVAVVLERDGGHAQMRSSPGSEGKTFPTGYLV